MKNLTTIEEINDLIEGEGYFDTIIGDIKFILTHITKNISNSKTLYIN